MDEELSYDEFAMLKQYADHEGISWLGQPQVVRRSFSVGSARRVSALVWGDREPEVALLHGNGQNAHTWDSVVMALGVPALAVDLPGHGHSDWREDHDYGAWPNADAAAEVVEQTTNNVRAVIGMSLGGVTAIRLAARFPTLVGRVVIIDITPGTGRRVALTREDRGAAALRDGPPAFGSFEEMLATTAASMPGRPIESLRPGVLHNSRRRADGRWVWRYDFERPDGGGTPSDRGLLWDDLGAIDKPIMLVRGAKSAFVNDEDLAEFRRRQPRARIELVEGAGHSIQSDRPVELARLIGEFIASTPDLG